MTDCGFKLVGLSAIEYNNYDRLLRYKENIISQDVSADTELDITRLRENYSTDGKVVNHLHQKQKRLNDDEVNQVIAGYNSGLSMNELAHKFDCHKTTISQRLKTAGIVIRRLPPSDNQITKMVELYQSGLSLTKVGDMVGISASTVLNYLRRRGIKTRDPHGKY